MISSRKNIQIFILKVSLTLYIIDTSIDLSDYDSYEVVQSYAEFTLREIKFLGMRQKNIFSITFDYLTNVFRVHLPNIISNFEMVFVLLLPIVSMQTSIDRFSSN